ncbi:MAG: PEP-CTERM sorting domain-containing protein [Fimbriimonadaceae bacterium]
MKKLLILALAVVGASAQATIYVFNSGPVTIPASGPATPNPIVFAVGALDGLLNNVSISYQGLSHTFPDDIGSVLFNPADTGTWLFDGPGGGEDLLGVTWNLDDSFAAALTDVGPNPSGNYKPGQNQYSDIFTGAPAGPYGTTFSVYNGTNGTGNWRVFLEDFVGGDSGSVQNIQLTLSTVPEPATMAALGLGVVALLRRRRK